MFGNLLFIFGYLRNSSDGRLHSSSLSFFVLTSEIVVVIFSPVLQLCSCATLFCTRVTEKLHSFLANKNQVFFKCIIMRKQSRLREKNSDFILQNNGKQTRKKEPPRKVKHYKVTRLCFTSLYYYRLTGQ